MKPEQRINVYYSSFGTTKSTLKSNESNFLPFSLNSSGGLQFNCCHSHSSLLCGCCCAVILVCGSKLTEWVVSVLLLCITCSSFIYARLYSWHFFLASPSNNHVYFYIYYILYNVHKFIVVSVEIRNERCANKRNEGNRSKKEYSRGISKRDWTTNKKMNMIRDCGLFARRSSLVEFVVDSL